MHRISLPFAEVWIRDQEGRLPTAEQLRRIGFRVSSAVHTPQADDPALPEPERPELLALPLGQRFLALPWPEDQGIE